MLHAIIMAGGTGTRFWPLSRNEMPKQFLRLAGRDTMIRQTVDRLGDLVPIERRIVLTNRRLVNAVRRHLPELPEAAIVGEPCKRDTAPCIGLAALLVSRGDPEATMAVMPADHVIRPADKFQAAIRQAVRLVDEQPDRMVTFGITPTYPAEIFGYVHRGAAIAQPPDAAPTFQVLQFHEKPDAATAEQYLASGECYWNSGVFLWRAATILSELRLRQPEMVQRLETIVARWDSPEQEAVFDQEFTEIQGLSIDYAVMEHATNDSHVAVIEAPFEWDDLGGWQSLARLDGSDQLGNTIIGRHLGIDTEATIVRTTRGHLVVTLGIKDCVVIHHRNATLVANKHDEEKIRQVVQELESRGWTDYL